jgi:hypothetical protein
MLKEGVVLGLGQSAFAFGLPIDRISTGAPQVVTLGVYRYACEPRQKMRLGVHPGAPSSQFDERRLHEIASNILIAVSPSKQPLVDSQSGPLVNHVECAFVATSHRSDQIIEVRGTKLA